MLRLITLIGLLGVGNTAMAEPVRMSGDDIKRAMPGALLEIDTPLRISIPVKVGTDGLVSAEAGALGLTLGATKDRGRWWTDGDKLCMKWFRWFDAKPRCMVLLRDGNRVQWSEGSGESGTATITEAAPIVAAVEPRHIPKKEKRDRTGRDRCRSRAGPRRNPGRRSSGTAQRRSRRRPGPSGGRPDFRQIAGVAVRRRSFEPGSAPAGRSETFKTRHERYANDRGTGAAR